MSGPSEPDPAPRSSARGIAGLIAANSTLLVAALVYMGWAYTSALWGYFHLNPLDLGVGVVEYMLRSLSLFRTVIVFAMVAFIAVGAARGWDLDTTRLLARTDKVMSHVISRFPRLASSAGARHLRTGRGLLITAGMTITLTGLALVLLASHIEISTYLLLLLIAGGPLMLTWPTRHHRHGRSPRALAIVVAAMCTLWAGSLYAHSLGIQAAQNAVRGLPGRTAVAVFSTQRLALGGPGVSTKNLGSKYRYHYCYEGLRLLFSRSGTYYLLPVGWNPRLNLTYIIADSDQTRIELYSRVQPIP